MSKHLLRRSCRTFRKSVLMVGLLLLPSGIASAQRLDVELVAGASEQVGRTRIEIRQWTPIDAHYGGLRAWGKRSVQAVVPDGNRSREIFLDWDEAADAPENFFWREITTVTNPAEAAPTMLPRPDRAEGDAVLHEETLKWRGAPGSGLRRRGARRTRASAGRGRA